MAGNPGVTTNCQGVTLWATNPSGANLIHADPTLANLGFANPTDANLQWSTLKGANWAETTRNNTTCPDGTVWTGNGGTSTRPMCSPRPVSFPPSASPP